MSKVNSNIEKVLNEITKAHENSHFKELPIPKLVAVSKKQQDYKVHEALKSGQRCFGENRVQEAQQRWSEKIKTFKNLELRLIGPLQTNKVKQALELFDIIETIDREKLAKEVSGKFNKDVKFSHEEFHAKLTCRLERPKIILSETIFVI